MLTGAILFIDIHTDSSIDDYEHQFTTALQTTFDKLAPIRTVTITHKKKPLVTPEILKVMKKRDGAFKRASQSHSLLDISEHKRLRSSVSNSLDTAKSKYLGTRITNV